MYPIDGGGTAEEQVKYLASVEDFLCSWHGVDFAAILSIAPGNVMVFLGGDDAESSPEAA